MKMTMLLLTVAFLQVSAKTVSQTVSFTGRNVPIQKVFLAIEKQTDYVFLYDLDILKVTAPITLTAKNLAITDFLNRLLKEQPLEYAITNQTILVTKKSTILQQSLFHLLGDTTRLVAGRIINEKGEPVSNATISVPGTTITTVALEDGSFRIRVPSGISDLRISSVGFEDVSTRITAGNQVMVTMKLQVSTAADDVVVIGYGVQKKSDLTGSVATVNIKDVGDRRNPDLASLIQGKVAGVDVNAGSIRVRGVTSFNNTDPLVVVDGFLGESMSTVNPNDIESIEVLKDASSTAIYGSRGANGVILVTTKKGRLGAPRVYVNLNSAIEFTPKKMDVLNASQYIDFVQEGLTNAGIGITPKLNSADVRVTRTDWQDEVFQKGKSNSVDVNFSGGAEKSTYYVSFGYKKGEGIVIGPKYDIVTARLKNDFRIKKWLKFGDNIALQYRVDKGFRPPQAQYMINMPPYIAVKDTSNFWGYASINRQEDLGDAVNPVASSALVHPTSVGMNYQANIWAELNPLKGLTYNVQAGVVGQFNRGNEWRDRYLDAAQQEVKNSYTDFSNYQINPIIESFLTYNIAFGDHNITAMAGNTWQSRSQNGGLTVYGQDYQNTDIRLVQYARSNSITNEYIGSYAAESYFGRLNYSFRDRYLLTANIRRDGSPRFAPSNRWGTFPSIAVAWKLHEENFIKNLGLFDQLKLRLSWGVSGNDAIGDFRYLPRVWTNGVFYPFGSTPVPVQGATILDDASQNIKWESTESKTVGLDMTFLNNRLDITAEYFIKNSNDILFGVPRPVSLGYGMFVLGGDAIVNAASCVNKGFELQASYRGHAGGLNYVIQGNYTNVHNKVTSLGLGQPYLDVISRTDIDNPIGYFYGYKSLGVFKTQAEVDAVNAAARSQAAKEDPALTQTQLDQIFYQLPATAAGDIKFQDLNGDGKISDDKDRTNIGNSIPQHLYGLSVFLDYKRFDFNVFFQGIAGSKLFYWGFGQTRGMTAVQNQETYVLDRWHSESDPGNGEVPRAIMGDPGQNNRASTRMVENGGYLKIRQLSIGYSIGDNFATKAGFSKIRFYLSSSNLLTVSDYSGYDPEYPSSNLNRGFQYLNFPPSRTFSLGVQLGL